MRRFLSGERSETGETLIEVLMASVLMAIVVVAVIGGISTMLLSSKVNRDQADGNAALVAAMEQVKAPVPLPVLHSGRLCPAGSPTPTTPSTYALPPNVVIKSIEYQTNGMDANGNPTITWSSLASDCDLTSVLTLQRITLQYTSPNATPTLAFIKGDY